MRLTGYMVLWPPFLCLLLYSLLGFSFPSPVMNRPWGWQRPWEGFQQEAFARVSSHLPFCESVITNTLWYVVPLGMGASMRGAVILS